MKINVEQHKLLGIVRDELDVEILVDYKTPYPNVLMHLRSLIREGFLEWEGVQGSGNERLRLTEAGRTAVEQPPPQVEHKPREDLLAAARIPARDMTLVSLPENE